MSKTTKILFCVLIIAALMAGSFALAGKPPRPTNPCKWMFLVCLDVWDPVECDDGTIYSNACYAKRACATGCVPTGGGPVEM